MNRFSLVISGRKKCSKYTNMSARYSFESMRSVLRTLNAFHVIEGVKVNDLPIMLDVDNKVILRRIRVVATLFGE